MTQRIKLSKNHADMLCCEREIIIDRARYDKSVAGSIAVRVAKGGRRIGWISVVFLLNIPIKNHRMLIMDCMRKK